MNVGKVDGRDREVRHLRRALFHISVQDEVRDTDVFQRLVPMKTVTAEQRKVIRQAGMLCGPEDALFVARPQGLGQDDSPGLDTSHNAVYRMPTAELIVTQEELIAHAADSEPRLASMNDLDLPGLNLRGLIHLILLRQ